MFKFIAAFFFCLVKSLLLFLPSPEIPNNEQPSSQSLSLPVQKNVNCAKSTQRGFFNILMALNIFDLQGPLQLISASL